MRIYRGYLVALACVVLTAAFAACGGSGSSTSGSEGSTAHRPGAPAAGSTKTEPEPAANAAGPKAATSAPSSPSEAGSSPGPAGFGHTSPGEPPVQRPTPPSPGSPHRSAKGAAAFLVPQGDNSIPNYGSEASRSELVAATDSLGAYLDARAGADWPRACSFLGAQVQKQLGLLAGEPGSGSGGCVAAYAKLASRIETSDRRSPLVGGLAAFRVEGDKAFALFYGPHEQQYMMPMVSEGGAWKANQLEPIPWPIGAPGPASP
jgi:hypothetical protein